MPGKLRDHGIGDNGAGDSLIGEDMAGTVPGDTAVIGPDGMIGAGPGSVEAGGVDAGFAESGFGAGNTGATGSSEPTARRLAPTAPWPTRGRARVRAGSAWPAVPASAAKSRSAAASPGWLRTRTSGTAARRRFRR